MSAGKIIAGGLFLAANAALAAYVGSQYLENNSTKPEPILSTPTSEISNPDHTLMLSSPTPSPTEFSTPSVETSPVRGFDAFSSWSRPFKLTLRLITSWKIGFGTDFTLHEDIPLPITDKGFDAEQNDVMHSAGLDNSNGNPFVIAHTDLQNMVMVLGHSYQKSSFDAFRLMGVALKQGRKDQLIGDPLSVQFEDGGDSIQGEIVDIMTMPEQLFEEGSKTDSSWGQNPDDPSGALFARTDVMGFPDVIRNDTTPGVYYVAFVTCISGDGQIYQREPIIDLATGKTIVLLNSILNSAERVVVFVKFKTP